MENRNGLCVLMDVQAAVGAGCAEHEVAERQLDELLMRGFNVKTTGALRQSRWRGVERTAFMTNLVAATCNLVRMARLMEESPPRYKTAIA